MPSASAKLEKQMSTEAYDPMKQILTIVEKKVRNLEKRKGKLDAYRLESQNGKELNEDQRKAVEKYEQVVELLDFAKDLQKQFQGVVQEGVRAGRRVAKREREERQREEVARLGEAVRAQELLGRLGGEETRLHFLRGERGAVRVSAVELGCLDELYRAVCPERGGEAEAAEHLQALIDRRPREAFGTTYKALADILHRIRTCSYFQEEEEGPTQKEEEPVTEGAEPTQEGEEQVSGEEEPEEEEEQPPERPLVVAEVLSGTHLDFLQESQIDAVSPQETAASLPNYSEATYPNRPSQEATPLLAAGPAFDPGRPIPTQTYTNASFHPLMAPPTQGYGPPVNMVQPLPQRTVSGLSSSPAHIYSLCLKMNQLNADQPAHVQSLQYEATEESKKSYGSNFQPDYERAAYQCGNNPAYVGREEFGDSYSSNLKRGLSARGGRSVGGPRGHQ